MSATSHFVAKLSADKYANALDILNTLESRVEHTYGFMYRTHDLLITACCNPLCNAFEVSIDNFQRHYHTIVFTDETHQNVHIVYSEMCKSHSTISYLM